MLPAVDVFVGKNVDWASFGKNLEFFLKFFEMRYSSNGVYIMRRRNGKAVDIRRNSGQ